MIRSLFVGLVLLGPVLVGCGGQSEEVPFCEPACRNWLKCFPELWEDLPQEERMPTCTADCEDLVNDDDSGASSRCAAAAGSCEEVLSCG